MCNFLGDVISLKTQEKQKNGLNCQKFAKKLGEKNKYQWSMKAGVSSWLPFFFEI